MNLAGKKIILGVTGSIASYKAVFLLRLLQKEGAEVRVVMTPDAERFVGSLTFASLSGFPVFSGLWSHEWSAHVEMGLWGDLMLVAPTTANTLAKFANGLCDNALTAVYLAAKCPVMLAPAMDRDMITHLATRRNLETLIQYGNIVLPTDSGYLASKLEGEGRMLEPENIVTYIHDFFTPKLLKGKKIMVTAGPTQEALDPVRYLSNHSSGKMGIVIAEEATRMGAEVTLLLGPTTLPVPKNVNLIRVISAADMLRYATVHADFQDIMIYAAAVADYTPEQISEIKIKKKSEDFTLNLIKTVDVLKTISETKKQGQILVGFALETDNEIENAKKKLVSKSLDFVVLNSLRDKGAGFAVDTNKITILDNKGNIEEYRLKPKQEVARDILTKVVSLLD